MYTGSGDPGLPSGEIYVWQVINMSSFKDVVGHKNIIKYIQNAVTADAVSHAYILNGERGSGKKLLANLLP